MSFFSFSDSTRSSRGRKASRQVGLVHHEAAVRSELVLPEPGSTRRPGNPAACRRQQAEAAATQGHECLGASEPLTCASAILSPLFP